MAPDLAVFGNLALDDVVYPDGHTRMAQPGGAVLYVALGARLWEVSVGVVSRIGSDYPQEILSALTERGIELEGVRAIDQPSLRTWLLYEGRRRRVVHRLDGPTHADVSPNANDLPAEWSPRAVHLAPMPWNIQGGLVRTLTGKQRPQLSLDPFELLTDQNLPAWRDLLTGVDLLFLSEDEMMIEGGLEQPGPVLERLAGSSSRLRQILYKQGARGGLLYEARQRACAPWAARNTEPVDSTGAGDAFAGGFLAGLLLGDPVEQALERGVVSASFALENWGADGLLAADLAAASSRL